MQLAKVVGNLVSTRKAEKLMGMKILVAVPVDMDTFEEKGAPFVTVDTIGAGEGEVVMCVGGSSSRQTDLTSNKPVDNSIVAIIDSVDILGKRRFDKAAGLANPGEKEAAESGAEDTEAQTGPDSCPVEAIERDVENGEQSRMKRHHGKNKR